METFGDRLKASIKRAGYTYAKIAEELDVNKSAVTYWVQDKAYPTVDNLIKLCYILGESADYLLGVIV